MRRLRRQPRPRRPGLHGSPRRGGRFPRPQRRGQDHRDRDIRRPAHALLREGEGIGCHPVGGRRSLAGQGRGRPAILARPREMAGRRVPRLPGLLLPALLHRRGSAPVADSGPAPHRRPGRGGVEEDRAAVGRQTAPSRRRRRARGQAGDPLPRRADPRGSTRWPAAASTTSSNPWPTIARRSS